MEGGCCFAVRGASRFFSGQVERKNIHNNTMRTATGEEEEDSWSHLESRSLEKDLEQKD
jgi:hypothetical protein